MREKSQREWYMTKDEDKQRSVLILSAFDIAAFQQVLFQKQYKGGVDLWHEEKGFVRLELKRSNYCTLLLGQKASWRRGKYDLSNGLSVWTFFSPPTNNCWREFFFSAMNALSTKRWQQSGPLFKCECNATAKNFTWRSFSKIGGGDKNCGCHHNFRGQHGKKQFRYVYALALGRKRPKARALPNDFWRTW